jgi:hypothetical protein
MVDENDAATEAAPGPDEAAPTPEEPEDKPPPSRPQDGAPPPVIVRIHPAAGPLGGRTRVVVEGSGFVEGSRVLLDRVPVTAQVAGGGELSFATLPRNLPGRVDVDIVNPDGQRTMVLRAFEYCEAPALSAIEPDHAPETGGVRATLVGANLREGCEVRIGASRPGIEYRGPTRVDIEIGAHPAGTFDVELYTPDGQKATLPGAFRFDGPPRVTSVAPDHGPMGTSARIAIEGEGFRAGCSVYVDGQRVAADVESNTRLVATVPPRATPGRVAIRVQNADGLGAEKRDAYEYDPPAGPRITIVVPHRVPRGREHPAAVTGSGFADGCSVRIGGQPVAVRFVASDRLEVVLPPGLDSSFAGVEVRNPDGQSHELTDAFELRGPPDLRAVQPKQGSEAGGMYIQLVGLGFERGCEVSLGGFPARTEWESDTCVRAVVPARSAGTGTVDVVVRNPDEQSATLSGGFVYLARQVPVIQSVEPTSGPATGGTGVLVRGEFLEAVRQVLLGGQPVAGFKARGAELAFVTPPSPREGAAHLELRAEGGATTLRKNAFQYTPVPPPAIRTVSPNRVGVAGGTEVTIAGENFFAGCKVAVGGELVAAAKVRDKATIVFSAPPGEAGTMADVSVRSTTGQEAVAKRALLYDSRYR